MNGLFDLYSIAPLFAQSFFPTSIVLWGRLEENEYTHKVSPWAFLAESEVEPVLQGADPIS